MDHRDTTRRRLIGWAGALTLLGGAGARGWAAMPAHATTTAATTAAPVPPPARQVVPEAASLLVPGPDEGPGARWAERGVAAICRYMPTAMALRVAALGGPDGVTAANRFASAAAPDGRMLLMLAGAAAQAQLVGDGRAKYEPRGWMPLCGLSWPAAVVGRGSFDHAMQAPGGSPPLRIAAPSPDAPEAAALLALEMAGRATAPVFGLSGQAAEAALAQGAVDAALLVGPGLLARAQAAGAEPWFAIESLPPSEPRETVVAGLGDLPLLADVVRGGHADLVVGCRAALAAVRLMGLVVLPALTPADLVATWRRATLRWQEEEAAGSTTVATLAGEPGAALAAPGAGAEEAPRVLTPAEASAALNILCPPPEAALAYREWLIRRLNWQPA